MKVLAVVLSVLAVAAALPRERRDSTQFNFELPSNASLIVGNIQTGFDCGDLPYGYYADEANNCAIFHICLPYIDNDVFVTRMFSYVCGEGTVFDQERLICDFPETARPCSESSLYRKSNEYFGRTDVNFLE
ncbi:uncharacterized protein [Macrobrachium rosenbergii]|uniref:uncharacterized protein n=1 Tax=Macrobrachium rosenbergii TaxID=79674 RepID=UPI0034D3D7E8